MNQNVSIVFSPRHACGRQERGDLNLVRKIYFSNFHTCHAATPAKGMELVSASKFNIIKVEKRDSETSSE